MRKKFREYNPEQLFLLPPSLKDWLPPEHPAHFIDEVVEQLDLSAIIADYSELRGNPPYNPYMMVKILVYGYWRGIRSSRKIERALYEDIGFRFLSANQQPNFWTIAAFRRRHHEALGDIFQQTVQLAQKVGLVKLEHVAVDGTKIKANASKHSSMSYGYMVKEEEKLRQEIEQYFKEADEEDAAEDREFGKGNRGDELPEELRNPQKRLEAIKQAMAELKARHAAKVEEEQQQDKDKDKHSKGRRKRGRGNKSEALPPDRAQYNFTDPDSRIMLGSEKAFIQGYNAQAAADADSQIIVAAEVTNNAADSPHLLNLIEQAERNTGQSPQEVSADAGYYSRKNIEALKAKGIEVFIPPDKVKHSEWRHPARVPEELPGDATLKEQMRHKLRTEEGRRRYKLRQTTIEPIFGQIKEGRGLRQFLLRDLDKVRSSWRFECAVHNLMKLFSFMRKDKVAILRV